jgi:hypothetical protein
MSERACTQLSKSNWAIHGFAGGGLLSIMRGMALGAVSVSAATTSLAASSLGIRTTVDDTRTLSSGYLGDVMNRRLRLLLQACKQLQ